jgi:hypothetical protein
MIIRGRISGVALAAAFMLMLPDSGIHARQTSELPPGYDVKIQARPLKATVGDPIQIDLDFTMPPGCKLRLPPSAAQVGDFFVLDTDPGPALPGAAPERGHHQVRFVVAVYKTGEFEFPSLPFALRSAGGNEMAAPSPAIKIRIDSVLARGDQSLKDLKKQAEIDEPIRWWLWITLAAAACLTAAAWWWLKRRRRSAASPVALEPEMDPLDLAEAEFRELLRRGLIEKGLIKQFHVHLSDIIKKALEGTYGVATIEKTTSEITDALRRATGPGMAHAEPAALEEIAMLLLSCDMVKFARYLASRAESEEATDRASRILAACRRRRQAAVARVISVTEGA